MGNITTGDAVWTHFLQDLIGAQEKGQRERNTSTCLCFSFLQSSVSSTVWLFFLAFCLNKFFGHDSCILINCRFSICFKNVCVEHGKVRLMWPQETRTRLGRKKCVILTGLREGISACYAGPQGETSEWKQKTEVLREFRSQPLLGFCGKGRAG